MSGLSAESRERLLTVLDAVCDQRASAADIAELEQLVLSSVAARRLYLRYLDVHGTLLWDGAGGDDDGRLEHSLAALADCETAAAFGIDAQSGPLSNPSLLPSNHATLETSPAAAELTAAVAWGPQPSRRRMLRWAPLVSAVCLALLCGVMLGRFLTPSGTVAPELAGGPSVAPQVMENAAADPVAEPILASQTAAESAGASGTPRSGQPARPQHGPVKLPVATGTLAIERTPPTVANSPATTAPIDKAQDQPNRPQLPAMDVADVDQPPADDVTRVSRQIDRELARVWSEMQIQPSPRASEEEWLRRVRLSLTGRIPTVSELQAWTSGDRAHSRGERRRELVDRLLADAEYVRHFSTVWSNLLIGRSPDAQVNREAFQKHLRLSFAENRPWNTMVAELLSAEGRTDENGATNYLVAHLNNQAVPATAITSRLFLGQQLHCAQCHNHPFNQVQQAAFWELNSVFQQTKVVRHGGSDRSRSGSNSRMGPSVAALVTEVEGGPIYYETTNGLMKVAFPRFNGQDVDPAPQVNRRRQLAELLQTTDQPQLAAAFVNRLWAHFFGAGFTTPVDDMGPHNPPCHPDVLNLLRDEFIRSNYDVKQLIRWIVTTDAYQRSSAQTTQNAIDDPTTGDVPLFSRVYPQPMTAEQLYDSLLTATRAHEVGQTDWEAAEAQRAAWLREFVVSLQNDENDEAETLSGTYGQALTLMNGELMAKALDVGPGSLLGEVARLKLTEAEKIERLYQTALSRSPTPRELAAVQRLARETAATRKSGSVRSAVSGLQDLFWALLNSNEFAIVH